MKTYEEMARNVLKRRDEELQKAEQSTFTSNNEPPEKVYPASGKRHLFPKIAIPCASVVTAAAVGLTVWHNVSPGENKGEYVFSDFKGSGRYSEDYAVTIDETIDPKDRDYSDVYKGGETEINYNDIGAFCPYVWPYKNSVEPTYKHSDFVSISDINYFYGIKFDRLNEVLGEGEHDPFGYHTRDVESDGVVMHSVRGYYNANTIRYVADDGLGGFSVAVTASFEKLTNAGELYSGLAPEAAKNPKPSVINGFDALVYQWNSELVTEIEMNGVYVTISAAPIDGVYRDPDAFTLFKKIYESYLTSYTAPMDDSDVSPEQEKLVINKGFPEYLGKHGFYRGGCISAPVRRVYFNHEEINKFYGIEFDRMGRLHSDWIGESSRYMEEICPEEFLCFVLTDKENAENGADGWDDENAEPNISFASDENLDELEYITSNNTLIYTLKDTDTSVLYIEAARTDSPKEMFSPFAAEGADPETFSRINGYNVLIWSKSKDGSTSYTAIIEMGKTLVKMSSSVVSEDVFLGFVREFTMPMGNSDSESTTEFHILDEMPQIVRDNDPFKPIDNGGREFKAMTIEETNSYYNIEFNRLGNLHSDWNERGRDKLGIYYKDYPSVETSNSAMAGGRDVPTGQINTLEYDIPNGKYISVSAVIGTIPGIAVEYGEYYRSSFVCGLDAIIYRGKDFDLGAMVQLGGTVVEFTSKGLSDEEFEDILCEFTEKNSVNLKPEYVFID